MKDMATGSKAPEALLSHDWLGACRRAAEGLQAVLRANPTSRQRVIETGKRGEGGDLTLVIDAAAEDAVFVELDGLYHAGARFTAVSEERGLVDYGDPDVLVVIDPIDGSMNAKRGLSHHALSVAVADGPTMADVAFGYVYDLGPGEEWRAVRGGGAFLNDEPLDDPLPERRRRDGKLELVAIESANPRWLRAMGSIAISLCQVAATRVDGMASLWNCRAVDAAAGQLVVRESGGVVAFTRCDEPLSAPLDLEPRSPVVAARTEAALAELATLPATDLDGTPYS
jgi:myo-inositol-1(or 4)-monophosphatase